MRLNSMPAQSTGQALRAPSLRIAPLCDRREGIKLAAVAFGKAVDKLSYCMV